MKVEAINKLIENSKEAVARYDGKSVLEMKQRILVELEDLRYFIIKEVKNDN